MNTSHDQKFANIKNIQIGFEDGGYICSQQVATILYLSYHLDKPILVEGPAGWEKQSLQK